MRRCSYGLAIGLKNHSNQCCIFKYILLTTGERSIKKQKGLPGINVASVQRWSARAKAVASVVPADLSFPRKLTVAIKKHPSKLVFNSELSLKENLFFKGFQKVI